LAVTDKKTKKMDLQELEQESQEQEEDSLKLYTFLVQYVRKHKSKQNPKDFTQQALNECTTITGPNRVSLSFLNVIERMNENNS
jgi:hypothetical protein